MSRTHRRGPSQRQLRIGEVLRHALADIFLREDINDPELAGVALTVTEVSVSPDAKNATAYVLPLGGMDQDAVVAALDRHRKFVRGQTARRVSLKYMPELTFELDRSFDQSARIDAVLRSEEVARDLDD